MYDVRGALSATFRWRSDPPVWPESRAYYADYGRWWRDPQVLGALGPALAALFADAAPTVVIGVESRESLLGLLVATHLGVGFAEVRKGAERESDDDAWYTRRTPPDYRDRHVELAVRRSVLAGGDRVLFVDDWIATGGQAVACQQLVDDAEGAWVGAAVIVDGLQSSSDRRRLQVRGLLHLRELDRLT